MPAGGDLSPIRLPSDGGCYPRRRRFDTRRPLFLLIFLLVFGLSSPAVVHAGASAEAERQLEFGRKELAQANFERAIASAESALRLDPAAYEAFIIKGLAYEQLGQLDLARSLLVAYLEITKGATQDPTAAVAMARIEELRKGGSRGLRRTTGGPTGRAKPGEPTMQTRLDIEAYRGRVKAALAGGQCAVAEANATEVTSQAPKDPAGWRMLGDAARCDGRTRNAAIAYRTYLELGGDDPKVELLLRGLLANLAVLEVRVERAQGGPLPLVRVELPLGDSLTPSVAPDGTLRFGELPTGEALVLKVAGRGLEGLEQPVAALGPGEVRALAVQPTYIGLGTIVLADFDPALCSVTFLSADGDVGLAPKGSDRITAGEVVALISGEHGEVEVPLQVAAGARLVFDPRPWLPTSLTVIDAPSGAKVRVFVEGTGEAWIERQLQIPPLGGRVDQATGVRLAEPVVIVGILGGAGGLFLEHPVLGEGSRTLVLEPGAVNATTFDWRAMAAVDYVAEHYQAWEGGRGQLQSQVRAPTVVSTGTAIGSGLASLLLFALAMDADRRMSATRAAAWAADDGGDLPEANRQAALNHQAVAQRTGFTVVGGITAGTAMVGVVFAVASRARGKKRLADYGEWDPTTLDPP